jgi:hypothetical protein
MLETTWSATLVGGKFTGGRQTSPQKSGRKKGSGPRIESSRRQAGQNQLPPPTQQAERYREQGVGSSYLAMVGVQHGHLD